MRRPISHVIFFIGVSYGSYVSAGEGAGFDEEILVTAPTPTAGAALALNKLPFAVQAVDDDALARAQALDLADFLHTNLGSVSINSAQNNPLQPDVQYRGFSASPLLGLSQGIAVYQNGARINEPFGDAVNWDLLPESAVHSMVLLGGSNPLFGLNALGGALSITMKNGFTFAGQQAEVYGGSWGRLTSTAESGGNNGAFGYYVNVSYFEENGWRDLSQSDALNVFTSASYRAESASIDISYQYADTTLRGNGPAPIGLLAADRSAIFTAPDITANQLHAATLEGLYDLSESATVSMTGYYRDTTTGSFNGDGSDLLRCALGAGEFLIEELEQSKLAEIGLDDDDVCAVNRLGVNDPDALETALNARLAGGATQFNIDDVTADLVGTGILSDAALNNISDRRQRSYGIDGQLNFAGELFGHGNLLIGGLSYYEGNSRFNSVVELATLDPLTRSTQGRGVGSFLADAATRVDTSTATASLYFLDSFDLSESLTLTAGGRYNNTEVTLRDRSRRRPELNGDHRFGRFNPTVGATFDFSQSANVYASYSESSRAPTPIELACNDSVFQIARAAASARGDDPDDVEFECRLPNAFLADPPLAQVVARSIEFGVRGDWRALQHRLGYFRTTSKNDIIFQTTGRGTGLFANVKETRREGFESAVAGTFRTFDWALTYSFIRATFEDDFLVLSPNHRQANEDGEISVKAGASIPGLPDHQLKLSGDYALPWNVRVGAELLVNSGQYLRGDESNQLGRIDGYAIVNLRATYAITQRFELFARVTNLFDTNYENFGLIGESPEEILPTLNNLSAVFLGAGAPRGAWLGLRVRI